MRKRRGVLLKAASVALSLTMALSLSQLGVAASEPQDGGDINNKATLIIDSTRAEGGAFTSQEVTVGVDGILLQTMLENEGIELLDLDGEIMVKSVNGISADYGMISEEPEETPDETPEDPVDDGDEETPIEDGDTPGDDGDTTPVDYPEAEDGEGDEPEGNDPLADDTNGEEEEGGELLNSNFGSKYSASDLIYLGYPQEYIDTLSSEEIEAILSDPDNEAFLDSLPSVWAIFVNGVPYYSVDEYTEVIKPGDTVVLVYSTKAGYDLVDYVVPDKPMLLAGPGDPEYKLLTGADVTKEYANWRFADGVTANGGTLASDVKNSGSGDNLTHEITFSSIYSFNDKKYDVHILVKKSVGIDYTAGGLGFPPSAGTKSAGDTQGSGNLCVSYDQNFHFLTIRMANTDKKTFDYEIWLTEPGKTEKVEYSKVPLVVGQVYNAHTDDDTILERIRIYSNENKMYTNTSNPSNITYDEGLVGYIMPKGNDSPSKYMLGLGSKDNVIFGGYSSTKSPTGDAACEIRLGYQAYSIEYTVASGSYATKPDLQYVPAKLGSQTYYPHDPTKESEVGTGKTIKATTSGQTLDYLEIIAITEGDNLKDAPIGTVIKDKNGKEYKVGTKISPTDMDEIAGLLLDHNVKIEIHTKDASKVNLIYHSNNVNINPMGVIAIQQENKDKDREKAHEASWVENQEYPGTDGEIYIFKGWVDKDGNPFTFKDGTTPGTTVSADTDIYAVWEKKPKVSLIYENTNTAISPSGSKVAEQKDYPGKDRSNAMAGTWTEGQEIVGSDGVTYRFDGWYKDDGTKFKFNDEKINSNTTIHAKWTVVSTPTPTPTPTPKPWPPYYPGGDSGYVPGGGTSGGGGGGSTPAEPEKPADTAKPEKPENPVDIPEAPAAEEAPAPEVIPEPGPVITAEEPVTVQYDNNDIATEQTPPTMEVPEGTQIEAPPAPVKEGYIFDGWYDDPEYTQLHDFSKPITEDTTIIAKWIDEDSGEVVPYGWDSTTAEGSGSGDMSGTDSDKNGSGDKSGVDTSDPVSPWSMMLVFASIGLAICMIMGLSKREKKNN